MYKSVIITGAGSGIGKSSAILFSQNNYHVWLLGRTESKLKETAKMCGPNAHIFVCDLGNKEHIFEFQKEIIKHPTPEILINNAAIYERHSFDEGGDSHWLNQFETNLFGPVRITQVLWPLFVKSKKGSIVNVSSTLGLRPIAQTSAYSASKAAMINWTYSLALEGGPLNIRANCVCPGIIDTPIHGFHNLPNNEKQNILKDINKQQPLGRIGTPEEVAKAIYFLATDQSSWTTASVLNVDGGINIF